MDVASIFSAMSGSSSVGNQRQPAPANEASATSAEPKSPVASQGETAAFRAIVGKFDVSQISPREFSEMLRQLDASGLLSEAERHELAAVRLELEQAGIDAEQPLDLVSFFQDKLREEERRVSNQEDKLGVAAPSRENSLAGTLRQLDWVKKFALLQQAKDYQPIDAVV